MLSCSSCIIVSMLLILLFFFTFYRLVRFLHPTDKELRQLLGLKKKDSKQNKRPLNGQNDNIDIFQIPKNLDISVCTY